MSDLEEHQSDGRRDLVVIDLSAVTTFDDLQRLLMETLDFPGWYGCNWNAFWDAITGLVQMPYRLRLNGWTQFEQRFPDDARLMRECLSDMTNCYPESAAKVEYV